MKAPCAFLLQQVTHCRSWKITAQRDLLYKRAGQMARKYQDATTVLWCQQRSACWAEEQRPRHGYVCVCVCVCARESEVPLRLKVQMKTWNKGMSVQDNLMQSRFPSNDIPCIHFGFLCFCRTFLAPGLTDVSHRQLKTSFRRSQTTLPMAKTKPIHQPLHVLYKHLKTGCVICGFFYSFHLFMTEE